MHPNNRQKRRIRHHHRNPPPLTRTHINPEPPQSLLIDKHRSSLPLHHLRLPHLIRFRPHPNQRWQRNQHQQQPCEHQRAIHHQSSPLQHPLKCSRRRDQVRRPHQNHDCHRRPPQQPISNAFCS